VELTARGETLRRTIRASVAKVEREVEGQLGHNAFVQLRKLLVALNETNFVLGD
jgi:hypothetical protein